MTKKDKKNKAKKAYEEAAAAVASEQQAGDVIEEDASQDTPPLPDDAPKTPEQERDELMGRLQRLAADYQNYQKRVQKDITHAREFANEGLMKELLTVLDDMERALAAAEENHGQDDPLLQGMQMVHNNLLAALKKFGLTTIDADGQPFDPARHQALMQQPSADVDPMTILQVLQRGYELKGRTLRPASVIVAKAPEDE